MIFFLVTRAHSYTLNEYLETWGRSQRWTVRALFYDQIPYFRRLERGSYIFADLERLDGPQMELAAAIHQTISRADGTVQLLNNPTKVLRREAMLRELHRRGLNPFAVYRVGESLDPIKFPVFLRQDNNHDGSLTDLLHSREELDRAIQAMREKGARIEDLLIVEYCQTVGPDGVFRKYSAFRVGGRVMARHAIFGPKWMLKFATTVTPETVAEEERYVADHPHEKELTEIFDLAHIDYGRIDYSLLNGRIVTWEINTNPMIVVDPMKIAPLRLPGQARFAEKFKEAMNAIDTDSRMPTIPFRPSPVLLKQLGIRRRDHALRRAGLAARLVGKYAPWSNVLKLTD